MKVSRFKELKSSLSYSQSLTNVPYPEPTESSPHSTYLMSVLILSFHLSLDLPYYLFPQGFLAKILYAFISSPM
jgi:hypothetical protein